MILKDVEPLELFSSNSEKYDAESYIAGAEAVLNKLDTLPVIDSDRLRPLVKRIKTRKHDWERNADGTINDSAWSENGCEGPVCKICGYHFCIHCDKLITRMHPERKSSYDEELCDPHYICSNCNSVLGYTDNYCANCGAKIEPEEYDD